mgnify:FL=1
MSEIYKEIVAFIRQLYNNQKGIINLHEPVFKGNEKKYLNDCIDSTFVSSVGKYAEKFEEMVAQYTHAKKAIVTVNGTNALHLALLSVGVNPGEEVLTQPLTFIATANAISYSRANPLFIDVDKDTLGMSSEKLYQWLKKNVKADSKQESRLTKTLQTIFQHAFLCIL